MSSDRPFLSCASFKSHLYSEFKHKHESLINSREAIAGLIMDFANRRGVLVFFPFFFVFHTFEVKIREMIFTQENNFNSNQLKYHWDLKLILKVSAPHQSFNETIIICSKF